MKLNLVSILSLNIDELCDECTAMGILEKLEKTEDWKSKDTAFKWKTMFQASDDSTLLYP